MKSPITIFIVLAGLNFAQAQTDFKEDPTIKLKNTFDGASDPISYNDLDNKRCIAFSANGSPTIMNIEAKTVRATIDLGPYFPNPTKKILWPDPGLTFYRDEFYNFITYTETGTELEIKLEHTNPKYNFTLTLRKSGKEVIFTYKNTTIVYGYCWK